MKKFIFSIIIALAALNCVAATESNKQTGKAQTERVESQNKKQDPVVGTYKGHEIHQGARGGLYWWYTAKTGKHAGEQVKHYLSKAEKEEFNQEKNK